MGPLFYCTHTIWRSNLGVPYLVNPHFILMVVVSAYRIHCHGRGYSCRPVGVSSSKRSSSSSARSSLLSNTYFPAQQPRSPKFGMFPLILTLLNRDSKRGYYNPPLRTVSIRGNIPTLNPEHWALNFTSEALKAVRSY